MQYANRIISILYRHGQRYFAKALKEYELPIEVGDVPALLQIFHQAGITQEGIAANTAMDKGTIARSVARLEELGLISREGDERDHRVNHLYATEVGSSLRVPLSQIIEQYHEQLYKGLSEEEITETNRLLRHIQDNITKCRPHCPSEHKTD